MKLKTFAARGARAALLLAASAALPAAAADWVVGANIGNVPWEFQDASGKFVGFEIDRVNEVAKRAGKTVQLENIPFNGLFPAVQSGRIQIAISSITITPKRLESLAFAQPYYDSDQSLSVLKAAPIKDKPQYRIAARRVSPPLSAIPSRTPRTSPTLPRSTTY